MKFPTIIKKYRIEDYSQLSGEELVQKFDFFDKKAELLVSGKKNHKLILNGFSIFLNLHNITQELFKRFPEMKDEIDFEGSIEEILEKNSINASKN